MGSIITGILVLIVCLLPFVLMSQSHRKKEKALLLALYESAQKNHCNISQYDTWSNAAIGIDLTSNLIFFTKKIKDINSNQQVVLADIERCRVVRTNHSENASSSHYNAIEKLELVFIYQANNKAAIVLEFYNAEHDGPTLAGELQLAEKWCAMANNRLEAVSNKA